MKPQPPPPHAPPVWPSQFPLLQKLRLGRLSKSHPIRPATATPQVVAKSSFDPRISDSWFQVLPLHILFPLPRMCFPRISARPPPSHPSGLSSNVAFSDHVLSSTRSPAVSIPFLALFSKCPCPQLAHLVCRLTSGSAFGLSAPRRQGRLSARCTSSWSQRCVGSWHIVAPVNLCGMNEAPLPRTRPLLLWWWQQGNRGDQRCGLHRPTAQLWLRPPLIRPPISREALQPSAFISRSDFSREVWLMAKQVVPREAGGAGRLGVPRGVTVQLWQKGWVGRGRVQKLGAQWLPWGPSCPCRLSRGQELTQPLPSWP